MSTQLVLTDETAGTLLMRQVCTGQGVHTAGTLLMRQVCTGQGVHTAGTLLMYVQARVTGMYRPGCPHSRYSTDETGMCVHRYVQAVHTAGTLLMRQVCMSTGQVWCPHSETGMYTQQVLY